MGVDMRADVLIILMVAFGLFSILMFVLFYVYLKKYLNEKHLVEDYEDSQDVETEEKEDIKVQEEEKKEVNNAKVINEDEMDFIPRKKK